MDSGTEDRKYRFAWFRDRCAWLHPDADIPLELARGVVGASAHWYLDDSGPRHVPGQAQHVTSATYGWGIYQSNTFEVTLFVKQARAVILHAYAEAIEKQPPKRSQLIRQIALVAHRCVTDYKDDLYDDYTHGRYIMAFGSHAIHTDRAAEFLLEQSGYMSALRFVPIGQRIVAAKIKSRKSQPRLPRSLRSAQRRLLEEARRRSGPVPVNETQAEWVSRHVADIERRHGRSLSTDQAADIRRLLTKLEPLSRDAVLTKAEELHRNQLRERLAEYIRRIH